MYKKRNKNKKNEIYDPGFFLNFDLDPVKTVLSDRLETKVESHLAATHEAESRNDG